RWPAGRAASPARAPCPACTAASGRSPPPPWRLAAASSCDRPRDRWIAQCLLRRRQDRTHHAGADLERRLVAPQDAEDPGALGAVDLDEHDDVGDVTGPGCGPVEGIPRAGPGVDGAGRLDGVPAELP